MISINRNEVQTGKVKVCHSIIYKKAWKIWNIIQAFCLIVVNKNIGKPNLEFYPNHCYSSQSILVFILESGLHLHYCSLFFRFALESESEISQQ